MSNYYLEYLQLDVDSDAVTWCCDECGALVGSKTIHDEWHERQEDVDD